MWNTVCDQSALALVRHAHTFVLLPFLFNGGWQTNMKVHTDTLRDSWRKIKIGLTIIKTDQLKKCLIRPDTDCWVRLGTSLVCEGESKARTAGTTLSCSTSQMMNRMRILDLCHCTISRSWYMSYRTDEKRFKPSLTIQIIFIPIDIVMCHFFPYSTCPITNGLLGSM